MKKSEALEVIALLEAGFVREIGDASRLVWAEAIEDAQLQDAVAAVRELMRFEDRFPSLAKLDQTINDKEWQRRREERALSAGDPARQLTQAEFKEFWGRVREELAARGKTPPEFIERKVEEPRLNEDEWLAGHPTSGKVAP